MNLQTFRALDAVSALTLVEQHLGEDALIHSVKVQGTFVSVTAAADPADPPKRAAPGAKGTPEPVPTQIPDRSPSAVIDAPAPPLAAANSAPAPFAPSPRPEPLEPTGAPLPPELAQAVRPAFLDPARPKPFGAPEPVQLIQPADLLPPPAEPQRNEDTQVDPNAAQQEDLQEGPELDPERPVHAEVMERAGIADARYIVLATLGLKAPFGVVEEFLHRLPRASASPWEEGGAIPWQAAPPEQPASVDRGPELILCQAGGAEFNRLMTAASMAPDVAFLLLLPRQAEGASLASLGRMLSESITGTILISDADEAATDASIADMKAAALAPLWLFNRGRLTPCAPESKPGTEPEAEPEPEPKPTVAVFRHVDVLPPAPVTSVPGFA